ncbi:MAG TPA: hypothetical protein VN038_17450 [Dyadobacter sp.]|nr:hypothetical protein [Dyadobacter sp.]
MNENAEKYELATPLIFGTGIGTLCTPLGPIVTIIGFAVGVCVGFWYDRNENARAKAQKKAPRARAAKKTVCH